MSPDLFLAFCVATLTFTVTPGPGSLYCASQSLAYGTHAGLRAALGLHVGGYIHVVAVSLGLTALLEAAPILFTGLKFMGAALLIWMGISMLRKSTRSAPGIAVARSPATFRRAIVLEAVNPTTAVFFLAFLPQFVDTNASLPVAVQFLILGTLAGVSFSVSDILYAVAAGRVNRGVRRVPTLRAWVERVGGSILIALGLKLAMSRSV